MSERISLHRRCSLTVAQGFLPWEPGRPRRLGTPKEFVKPSATPSELRIRPRIIPRVGNPGLRLMNTFGVRRGIYRAVDCYQVICCSTWRLLDLWLRCMAPCVLCGSFLLFALASWCTRDKERCGLRTVLY